MYKYRLLGSFAILCTLAGLTGLMWNRFDRIANQDTASAQNTKIEDNKLNETVNCKSINSDGLIIYVKNGDLYSTDFTGSCKTMLRDTGRVISTSRSPNGSLIAFTEEAEPGFKNTHDSNAFMFNMETREVRKFNKKGVDDTLLHWSHDSRFVLYKEDGLLNLYYYYLPETITLQDTARNVYISNSNEIIMYKSELLSGKSRILIYNSKGALLEAIPFSPDADSYMPLFWSSAKKTLLGYSVNEENMITGFMTDGLYDNNIRPFGTTSCNNDPGGDLNPFPLGVCGATSVSLTTNLAHLLIAKNSSVENSSRVLLYDLKRNTYKEIKDLKKVSKIKKMKWNTYNSVFVLNTDPDLDGYRSLYAYHLDRQTLYTLDTVNTKSEKSINDDSQLDFSTGYAY